MARMLRIAAALALWIGACSTPPPVDVPQPDPPDRRRDVIEVTRHAHDGCTLCNLYEDATGYVVRITTDSGLGSGIVVSSDGLVATNAHVIGTGKELVIETYAGARYEAELVASDAREDLALLRPRKAGGGWSPVVIDAGAEARVGSDVFVVGHPVGLGWTVTRGIVSARRFSAGMPMIQTDAPISPGNSGGPMLDAHGHLIGIVTSKALGGGVENVAFARPASSLLAFLEREGVIGTP